MERRERKYLSFTSMNDREDTDREEGEFFLIGGGREGVEYEMEGEYKRLNTAQESIGECPRARQYFISQEMLEATDTCRAAHLTGDQDLHHSQVRCHC